MDSDLRYALQSGDLQSRLASYERREAALIEATMLANLRQPGAFARPND